MDRQSSPEVGSVGRSRPAPTDFDLLPTRRRGLEILRRASASAKGPILITGEPGVGKSFLSGRFDRPPTFGMKRLVVDIAPVVGPDEFYHLIGQGLGVDPTGFTRLDLPDHLAERSLEAERWILVVEEAHNLGLELFEEIRILSNRLGRTDGFATILLVGQTVLARRLSRSSGLALASRLAAHIHLRPLDADEAHRLLQTVAPSREWKSDLVDRLHLASEGIPRRLLGLASEWQAKTSEVGSTEQAATPLETKPIATSIHDAPLIGPSKPPIRVEDGLIEVGWEPEDEIEEDGGDLENEAHFVRDADFPAPGEEPISDRDAALRAWQDWAENQGRHPAIAESSSPGRVPIDTRLDGETTSSFSEHPNVWIDEEHGFAPFGRLFSRLKQENEPE